MWEGEVNLMENEGNNVLKKEYLFVRPRSETSGAGKFPLAC